HILTELGEMCDRVAIIERGKLLAVGSVEEIQKQQTPHREVKVRILGDISAAAQWVTAREDVQDVVVEGPFVRFTHQGQRDSEVELLREMVTAGLAVAEF